MLHNDAAQQRAGEQPASAPKASQKFPRAQTAAKLKILTLKQANSRHGDIVATGLRDGSMGAMPIHIYSKHSPLFLPMTHDTATHATRQWSLHPEGLMASPPLRTCTNDSLHDTILLGMDTCGPTLFSDLSLVRGNNSFMHGMARPANLRPRSSSLNHQRCRRRRGHAKQHKQGQTAKER